MSKSKKKKRKKYPHVVKMDYLLALADRIFSTAPTKQIIFNTMKDVYSTGYTCGYQRKHDEMVRFRQKQEQHLADEFKLWQDYIDDKIHNKDGVEISFDDWCLKQKELKNKSNNQPKK